MTEAHLTLEQLSIELGAQLLAGKLCCSCAESCTGGLVAKSITDVAGSSAWFEQGWVTYSNTAKANMLGVPESVLQARGAVSEEVVISMATAARKLANSDIAVSISGVAGPGGGSAAKPVGTVWIAWSTLNESFARHFIFAGNREQVRLESARAAIIGVIELSR